METVVFLVLVFCYASFAETVQSHKITKREAEVPSELQLENELKRVKRIVNTDNVQGLARVKRMKSYDQLQFERELSRLARVKRSFFEPNLIRLKRSRRSTGFVLPELSRVKRFKDLELGMPNLYRVKRLKRAALRRSLSYPYLSRMKRTKRSLEFAMPELSRTKRFHDRNIQEFARVKRSKREVSHLLPSRKAKRIPPTVHKLKRIQDRKLEHILQSDAFINNHRENSMKRSQRKHFRALHGNKLNMNKHINVGAVQKELSLESNGIDTKRHRNKYRKRFEKRLREKQNWQKNRLNHKLKVKKDKHHVQSHRINKKTGS